MVRHDAASAMRLLKPPFCLSDFNSPCRPNGPPRQGFRPVLVQSTPRTTSPFAPASSSKFALHSIYPAGDNNIAILCSMLPKSRRVSWLYRQEQPNRDHPGSTYVAPSFVLHRHRWFLADVTALGLIYANEDQAHRITVLFPIYPRKFRT